MKFIKVKTYSFCKTRIACKHVPIIISQNTPKSFSQYFTRLIYETKIGIFLERTENLKKQCLTFRLKADFMFACEGWRLVVNILCIKDQPRDAQSPLIHLYFKGYFKSNTLIISYFTRVQPAMFCYKVVTSRAFSTELGNTKLKRFGILAKHL